MKLENIWIKEDKWHAILKNAVIYYRNKIANKVQVEVHICEKMKVRDGKERDIFFSNKI